jgi:MATE family multidrug resistance protein
MDASGIGLKLNARWNREGGPSEVLKAAWPLMMSTSLFAITLFVDRTLLFYYSRDAVSGALGAGVMFWTMTCVPIGLLGFTSTFVAQYVGINRIDKAIQIVRQGFLVSIAMIPLVAICAWVSKWFFSEFHDQELVNVETHYFRWVSVGAWASIAAAPLIGLFAGTGRTRVLLWIDLIITVINGVLDWLLIFGKWGLPELGIVGAALATSIALMLKLIIMFCVIAVIRWDASGVMRRSNARQESFFRGKWHWDSYQVERLFYFGWPAAISALVESASFSIIVILVGKLGAKYVEATTLALNINLLAFVPLFGLSQAVGVLVGQRLTSGRLDLAKRSVQSGLLISIIFSSCFAIVYTSAPNLVLSVYSHAGQADRFDEIRPMVVPLLWFIAAYCVFDGIQIVLVGALKGAGDTTYVLFTNFICGVGCVAGGKILGDLLDGKLLWWWGVITAWVVSLSLVFTLRYLHGGWLNKRVIEPDLT